MGKDELGDALMDFSKHIHVATLSNMGGAHACESYARDAEQYLMEAKSAILAWCLKQVPEKKDLDRCPPQEEISAAGFNDCVDEMRRRLT